MTAMQRSVINCSTTAKRFIEITKTNYRQLFAHGLGMFNENQIGMFLVKEDNGFWYLVTRDNWIKSRVRRNILNEMMTKRAELKMAQDRLSEDIQELMQRR